VRVLDLFSGIGGFSLGLERAGMKTAAFCEIEPYCRAVLAKHWPGVPIYEDIRTLSADVLERDGIAVDAICGGFPCQDLSHAGKRAGLEGERSGLWGEYRRLIGEIRPRFVIVENVPGLLSLGMGTVLGDISALGYDAVWDCIPASAAGAPHRRDRVWVVAHTQHPNAHTQHPNAHNAGSHRTAQHVVGETEPGDEQVGKPRSVCEVLAEADNARLEGWQRTSLSERASERIAGASGASMADASRSERERDRAVQGREQSGLADAGWWQSEPDVGRVANGVPARAHRLKALGNAVVPQVVEIIGRAIMQAEAA